MAPSLEVRRCMLVNNEGSTELHEQIAELREAVAARDASSRSRRMNCAIR